MKKITIIVLVTVFMFFASLSLASAWVEKSRGQIVVCNAVWADYNTQDTSTCATIFRYRATNLYIRNLDLNRNIKLVSIKVYYNKGPAHPTGGLLLDYSTVVPPGFFPLTLEPLQAYFVNPWLPNGGHVSEYPEEPPAGELLYYVIEWRAFDLQYVTEPEIYSEAFLYDNIEECPGTQTQNPVLDFTRHDGKVVKEIGLW